MEIASKKEITTVSYPEISENFQGPGGEGFVTSWVYVNIVYWEPVGDIINT